MGWPLVVWVLELSRYRWVYYYSFSPSDYRSAYSCWIVIPRQRRIFLIISKPCIVFSNFVVCSLNTLTQILRRNVFPILCDFVVNRTIQHVYMYKFIIYRVFGSHHRMGSTRLVLTFYFPCTCIRVYKYLYLDVSTPRMYWNLNHLHSRGLGRRTRYYTLPSLTHVKQSSLCYSSSVGQYTAKCPDDDDAGRLLKPFTNIIKEPFVVP